MPDEKYKHFFQNLENTSPFYKMAAEGAAGSGKTHTLALIAFGLHKYIKSEKPIVIFDTERAAKFLLPMAKKEGIKILVKESRSLKDLADTMDFCNGGINGNPDKSPGGADILIIDSITHVWEGFMEAYKKSKNRSFIQFQDWGLLKPAWKKEYSDRLVMGNYHIFFTGREGYTYEQEMNEVTGKKEIVKSGVKMKAEGDTAYEPDVLLRMERFENLLTEPKEVWREATVLKGRGGIIDGMVFKNPTFEDFLPQIEFILGGKYTDPIPQQFDGDIIKTEEDHWEERSNKTILLEEIETLFKKLALGTGKEDQAIKMGLLDRHFLTRSWTKIEQMSISELEFAYENLTKDAQVLACLKSLEETKLNL